MGTTTPEYVPTGVPSERKWTSISAGGDHTCAIDTNAALYCWGHNAYGQLGLGDTSHRYAPTRLGLEPEGVTAVSAGGYHSCGIRSSNGALYCWGQTPDGQLGLDDRNHRDLPARG